MEYSVDILRGWPNDGARERFETITAAATLSNGDWVAPQSDGTVNKVGALGAGAGTRAAGLVVRGNGDAASGANTTKAVVLWGNFIARVSNYTAGAYVAGSPVTADGGKIRLAAGADLTSGVGVLGHVIRIVPVSATETAHLVVVFY